MFRLVKILGGRINQGEPMYLPKRASDNFGVGQALALEGGYLTQCGSTKTPTYMCCGVAKGESLPVYAVAQDMIFECPLTGDVTALKLGDKVTLAEDGMGVSDVTASGVAEILDLGEGDSGVFVKF